jgi:threonyl-tRNA synthetase
MSASGAAGEPLSVTLPDGSQRSVPRGSTAEDALRAWDPAKLPRWLAAALDGVPIDLRRPLPAGGRLEPISFEDRRGKEILHHSAAHVVAKAVCELVPDARPTVGPATEENFYYDFEVRPLTPEDRAALEKIIRRIVDAKEPFRRIELSREEALGHFATNPHKQRYIAEAPANEPISIYRTGDWEDLCRGPHVPHAGWVAGLEILGISGVTLGGTPDGLPLQRIRGVAFPTRAELQSYLKMREEAEARDHRALGSRLELFTFVDECPGFPFWLPRGMLVIRELERFLRERLDRLGYVEVRTPILFAQSVFERSGHWEHFRANMFLSSIEERTFGVKPMNCPGAMIVFGSRARSYRELPLRLMEFAPLHRLEASGTLHGLTRVRELVQDDAHLFVTEEQIEAELTTLLELVRDVFSVFRLSWTYELSTRPESFLGDASVWDKAEATLRKVLEASNIPFTVSPGQGGFYGPKIDIHIRDSMGRPWQTGTIQLDYQMPLRFQLRYQGADGELHAPVVIHRTIIGSFERFTGVLLEHTAGRLPPWLAPVQVRVLPVAERHAESATALVRELEHLGIRAELRATVDTLGKRVREAEVDRIPYVVVLGNRELAENTATLRLTGRQEASTGPKSDVVERIANAVRTRSYEP